MTEKTNLQKIIPKYPVMWLMNPDVEPLISRRKGPLSGPPRQSYPDRIKPSLRKWQKPKHIRWQPSRKQDLNSRRLSKWQAKRISNHREPMGQAIARRNFPNHPPDLPDAPWVWLPYPHNDYENARYAYTLGYVARDYWTPFRYGGRKTRHGPISVPHGNEIAARQVSDIVFRMLLGKKDPIPTVTVPDYFDYWPPANIVAGG